MDDDAYLYGESAVQPNQPIHYAKSVSSPSDTGPLTPPLESNGHEEEEEQAMEEEDDGSDSDLEIITDRVPMVLDNRRKVSSTAAAPQPLQATTTSSSLTTEYTPRERLSSLSQIDPTEKGPEDSTSSPVAQSGATEPVLSGQPPPLTLDDVDTSKLPPVIAPASHPSIDPTIIGVLDGRTIFDHDMDSMTEKPWRKPGSNISDWFNYGFDEISWEAYCYRRKQLGEDAAVLRANVINFSGLPDDQITSLPPEVRSVVMTGTTTLMNSQQSAAMMPGAGMGMNPMMAEMSMQMPMNMAQMQGPGISHQMPPDMGPPGIYSAMPPQQNGQNMVVGESLHMGSSHTPEIPQQLQPSQPPPQHEQPSVPTPPRAPSATDHGSQVENASVEGSRNTPPSSNHPVQPPSAPAAALGRGGGGGYTGFRGSRGAPPSAPARGRSTYRGRGMNVPPPRPTSPLPPNVPTGPRSQTRYKDRDVNPQDSDKLDYGANKDSYRDYNESDDRGSRSRKRRASPERDDYSGRSKRR